MKAESATLPAAVPSEKRAKPPPMPCPFTCTMNATRLPAACAGATPKARNANGRRNRMLTVFKVFIRRIRPQWVFSTVGIQRMTRIAEAVERQNR